MVSGYSGLKPSGTKWGRNMRAALVCCMGWWWLWGCAGSAAAGGAGPAGGLRRPAARGARLAPVLRTHIYLRGGTDDKLAPEAIADARASGLRPGSVLSRSADLARRTWITARAASTEASAGEADGRGGPANASLSRDGNETEGVEDDRRDVWAGVAAGPRLRCTVVEPSEKHTATIIWLHGRGHEPDDLITGDLRAALAAPWCKFIYVHSPKGSGAHGGLDVVGKWSEDDDDGWGESERGGRWLPAGQSPITEMDTLMRLVNGLLRLIRHETSGDKGVPSQRIVLAGHGEGGVVAMAAALSCRQPLGGLISLSSWFPRVLAGWCDGQTVGGLAVSYAARRTPALMCHGLGDLTVPAKEGKDAAARLVACGILVLLLLLLLILAAPRAVY